MTEAHENQEYGPERALDETVDELSSKINKERQKGLQGTELEMNVTENGSIPSSETVSDLFDYLEDQGGFERTAEKKVEQTSHPFLNEPEFSPEIDTDIGLNQLEAAGAPQANAADMLFESLRMKNIAFNAVRNYGESVSEQINIEDSSLIESWRNPQVNDPLNIQKIVEVASGKGEFTDKQEAMMMQTMTSGPRYEAFVESDGSLVHSMQAPVSVHVNASLPEDADIDEYVSAAVENHGLQKFLEFPFANGPIVTEEGNSVHSGRLSAPYHLFSGKGKVKRSLDNNGEPRKGMGEYLGEDVPLCLSYMDIVDRPNGEEIKGLRDLVDRKFSGPLKRIEDLDPEFLQFDADLESKNLPEEGLWAQVRNEGEGFWSVRDYVEEGFIPVNLYLEDSDELVEARYKLPEEPDEAKEQVLNLYEDGDTFTRAGVDLKSSGLVEARIWSTNIERLSPEILAAVGSLNSLTELDEMYKEIFGIEGPEKANRVGTEIEMEGPDALGGPTGSSDHRLAYRELIPAISEGVRSTFREDEIPYTMEAVLENRDILEDGEPYGDFYELMDDSFETMGDFMAFQEMVFSQGEFAERRYQSSSDGSEVYRKPGKGQYEAETYESELEGFVDWFIEKGLEEPMEHYLDPEVPTRSQQMIEEITEDLD